MLNAPTPVIVHDNELVKQARQANSLTPAPARLFIRQRQSPARQTRKAVRVDFGWLHSDNCLLYVVGPLVPEHVELQLSLQSGLRFADIVGLIEHLYHFGNVRREV